MKDVALLAEATKNARTDKEKQTIAEMDRALKAYIESWHVIQGLYADEARIYEQYVIAPSAAIRSNLAKLRDDAALDAATSRLIAEARDGFMASELLAFQYRSAMKPADADQLKVLIGQALLRWKRPRRRSGPPLAPIFSRKRPRPSACGAIPSSMRPRWRRPGSRAWVAGRRRRAR